MAERRMRCKSRGIVLNSDAIGQYRKSVERDFAVDRAVLAPVMPSIFAAGGYLFRFFGISVAFLVGVIQR